MQNGTWSTKCLVCSQGMAKFQPCLRQFRSLQLWSIIYPLGVVIFGVLLVRRFPLQHRLANEGVAARACITEREWKKPSRGPIMVDYTFRNVNDEVEIGTCPSEYPRKAGSFVWILYLPSDPRQSAIYPLEFFRLDQ